LLKVGLFLLNVAMITYLAIHLWKTRGEKSEWPASAGTRAGTASPLL